MNAGTPLGLTFAGVVLAGGRSSRMGQNKAMLVHCGTPLWRRQYELLADVTTGERWLSVRSGDDWLPSEIPRIVDDGAAGPLGGIEAALSRLRQTHLVVVAVDLPALSTAWLSALCAECQSGVGAVGQHRDDKTYEPLAAIYPRELLDDVTRALDRSEYSLQSLIRQSVEKKRLLSVPISSQQMTWFKNWNSPSDVTTS